MTEGVKYEDLKELEEIILKRVREGSPKSRRAMAKELGLDYSQVKIRVRAMIARGKLVSHGHTLAIKEAGETSHSLTPQESVLAFMRGKEYVTPEQISDALGKRALHCALHDMVNAGLMDRSQGRKLVLTPLAKERVDEQARRVDYVLLRLRDGKTLTYKSLAEEWGVSQKAVKAILRPLVNNGDIHATAARGLVYGPRRARDRAELYPEVFKILGRGPCSTKDLTEELMTQGFTLEQIRHVVGNLVAVKRIKFVRGVGYTVIF
jgi:DNA-binding CsgD family transcriptional regulator